MTEDAQMKIRLPRSLKDRVEAASDESKRSLNAEIVERLEQSFTAENVNLSDLQKRVAALETLLISVVVDDRYETLESRVADLESHLKAGGAAEAVAEAEALIEGSSATLLRRGKRTEK